MPTCPICALPLITARQREGVFYPCPGCDGRALTISQVRHVMGDSVATMLLRLMKCARHLAERHCPFCEKSMWVIHTEAPRLQLDICRACHAAWFDRPTYDLLPQVTAETMNSMPMQATEIIALERLKELKQRQEAQRKKARRSKLLHRDSESDEKNRPGRDGSQRPSLD